MKCDLFARVHWNAIFILPTIVYGYYDGGAGQFISCAWLGFEAGIKWSEPDDFANADA